MTRWLRFHALLILISFGCDKPQDAQEILAEPTTRASEGTAGTAGTVGTAGTEAPETAEESAANDAPEEGSAAPSSDDLLARHPSLITSPDDVSRCFDRNLETACELGDGRMLTIHLPIEAVVDSVALIGDDTVTLPEDERQLPIVIRGPRVLNEIRVRGSSGDASVPFTPEVRDGASVFQQGQPRALSPLVRLLRSVPSTLRVSTTTPSGERGPQMLLREDTAWNSAAEDEHPAIEFAVPDDAEVVRVRLSCGWDRTGRFHQNPRIRKVHLTRNGEDLGEHSCDHPNEINAAITMYPRTRGGNFRIEVTDRVAGRRSDWTNIVVTNLTVDGRHPRASHHQPTLFVGERKIREGTQWAREDSAPAAVAPAAVAPAAVAPAAPTPSAPRPQAGPALLRAPHALVSHPSSARLFTTRYDGDADRSAIVTRRFDRAGAPSAEAVLRETTGRIKHLSALALDERSVIAWCARTKNARTIYALLWLDENGHRVGRPVTLGTGADPNDERCEVHLYQEDSRVVAVRKGIGIHEICREPVADDDPDAMACEDGFFEHTFEPNATAPTRTDDDVHWYGELGPVLSFPSGTLRPQIAGTNLSVGVEGVIEAELIVMPTAFLHAPSMNIVFSGGLLGAHNGEWFQAGSDDDERTLTRFQHRFACDAGTPSAALTFDVEPELAPLVDEADIEDEDGADNDDDELEDEPEPLRTRTFTFSPREAYANWESLLPDGPYAASAWTGGAFLTVDADGRVFRHACRGGTFTREQVDR